MISSVVIVAFRLPFFAKGDGLGAGVSLGVGLTAGLEIGLGDTEGRGVADGSGVALGAGVAGAVGDGLGASFFFVVANAFRCLRTGIGVGVLTKKSLIFLEKDSSSSSTARIGATIANAAAIMIKSRTVLFILRLWESGCQFLEDSFIHSDARVEVLQRKIFVR